MRHGPRLFHVSENASISEFLPRRSATNPLISEPVVWAVDQARLPNWLLPSDCARVCFSSCAATSDEDRARFLSSGAERVICIQADDLPASLTRPLTVYEFDPAPFVIVDDNAGHWIARVPVKPLGQVLLANGVAEIVRLGVELRVLPALWPIRDAVIQSTLAFSVIRIRNAKPRQT